MSDASALGYGDVSTMQQNLAVLGVGAAVNGALFGVFSGQVAFYMRHSYHGERPSLKGVVLSVCTFNVLHLALYIYSAWELLVTAHAAIYDRVDAALPWSTYAQIFLNSIAVLLIQTFYAHRIWKIGRSIAAIAVLGLFIICTFTGGIVLFTYTVLAVRVTELYPKVVHIEKAVSVMFAVTDIALTSLLLFVLIRSSKEGPSPLVKRLAYYTLSTGVLTCVSALAGIVLIFLFPDSIMSTIIWYTAASLYSTSLMASLNAREKLRSKYNVSTRISTSSGSSTMPRFAPPCMSATSQLHSVSMGGMSIASHIVEAAPLTCHSEIVAERRSSQSYVDIWEKPADMEKQADTKSPECGSPASVDSATSTAAVEAGDAIESGR